MIAHLKGIVEKVAEGSVILDVGGVGYSVICSSRTLSEAKCEMPMKLLTELVVKEDAWTLYGFATEQEKFWFNTLTQVQGVGGRIAIAILSTLSDDEIYNGFLSGDKGAFARATGVGPRLSARIISELKDKIVGKVNVVQNTTIPMKNGVVDDVISALTNLGYQRGDVVGVLSKTEVSEDAQFDVLLKQTLSKLASGVQ